MTPKDLMSAAAVRHAAERMFDAARADKLSCWHLNLDALKQIARTVAHVTRANYPQLDIPIHSRWRHFTVDGVDRWATLSSELGDADGIERARRAVDLVIPSVLLDAGSGGKWSYSDRTTRKRYTSSEGLALASLDLYRDVVLPIPDHALDAERLITLNEAELARVFQVRGDNPLSGVAGRVALLNKLGEACLQRPDIFAIAGRPRPGGLVDAIRERTTDGQIEASAVLALLLDALGMIWPSRLILDGMPLGDAWLYRPWQARDQVAADAIVPLHKLSQWLTYSLIEPLRDAGIRVIDIGGLTGLAEYRNGGLFVDGGALRLKDAAQGALPHSPDSILVIEWRAMTIALLDRLRPLVAKELDLPVNDFPLARLLEGGSWAAGRRLAKELRADGSPPIFIVSDGTVF
jgi:hypothetical protein